MTSLFLVAILALVALTASNPTECEGCDYFPTPCFQAYLSERTGRSFFDAQIKNGGVLSDKDTEWTTYDSFCIDPTTTIVRGIENDYAWAAQSSLDVKFVELMTTTWGFEGDFENFDSINWIMTHLDDADLFSDPSCGWKEVQTAIWWLVLGEGTEHSSTGGRDTDCVQELYDAAISNDGFEPTTVDECYALVIFPTGSWDQCEIGTVIAQTQIIRICLDDFMYCSVEDTQNLSEECNNQGYCVAGEVSGILACSCAPGFAGEYCETELDRTCSEELELTHDASDFTTTIDGEIDSCGNVHISITAPIEPYLEDLEDDETNYATYTRLFWRNQDSCDYPEATRTVWDISEGDNCTTIYDSCTSFQDLLLCNGADEAFCSNSDGDMLPIAGGSKKRVPQEGDCEPSWCESPPCYKCYPGQIQTERGYSRTSLDGGFTLDATAENCHYWQICLPWIAEVETTIDVIQKPNLENQMILGRVAYDCFDDANDCEEEDGSWTIEILSDVVFPFAIRREGPSHQLVRQTTEDEASYDMMAGAVGIVTVSGCGQDGERCVQRLSYTIPDCDSLSTAFDYLMTGLVYDCYNDCGDLLDGVDPEDLEAVATVRLQASDASCADVLTISGTDSVSLTFDSYLDAEFEDQNNVFVYTDDESEAYFKLTVTSTAPASPQIISLYRTVGDDAEEELVQDVNWEIIPCTSGTKRESTIDICLTANFGGIIVDDSIEVVTYRAVVETNFESGTKRSFGLNSEHALSTNIRVVDNREDEPTSSAAALAISFASLLLL